MQPSRVKTMRENVKDMVTEYHKTEDDLKALQVHLIYFFYNISPMNNFCIC